MDDLIDGIYKLFFSDDELPMNIGNPNEITIAQFAKEIIKLTGTTQKVIYQPLSADDPRQRQPDITKAKTILNWEPKISRSEGLKRIYEYFTLPREVLYKGEYKDFEQYKR